MKARVQFLASRQAVSIERPDQLVELWEPKPGAMGSKCVVEVEVVHLSRAEQTARTKAGLRADEWALYGLVEQP
ncbi:MAG TPA: hypothetical protein VLA89_05590 [Gemmatimonadales bacterium]|nr:hypothetical protein [Gemmatimonadales bacterium]